MKKLFYISLLSFVCSFLFNTTKGKVVLDHQVTRNENLRVFKKFDKQNYFKSEENDSDNNDPVKRKKRKRPKGTETNGHLIQEYLQKAKLVLVDLALYSYNFYHPQFFFSNGKRGPPVLVA